MYPRLFTLPFGLTVTTYGFCLMIGFLSAVWLAMRRASRVNANPDVILDLSFRALIFGVGGARLMYVIHYWSTSFADQPNKLLAVIDIRNGGLEFLGGFLGAALAILYYLVRRRESARLYLDILAPGAMWGLAIGRIGCFFNGCCFGGVCPIDHQENVTSPPAYTVSFPFGSLAYSRQWEERKVTVPAELIVTSDYRSMLLSGTALSMSVEERGHLLSRYRDAKDALDKAKAGGGDSGAAKNIKQHQDRLLAARREVSRNGLQHLRFAMEYPSRENPSRNMSSSELESLASGSRTVPIYASQLFSSIHAMVLSLLLSAIFHYRKRHGVVIGILFLLYPIGRVLLEMIRADNPHDVAGLTVSQSLSLAMSLGAAIYLVMLYKSFPERSPALLNKSAVAAA